MVVHEAKWQLNSQTIFVLFTLILADGADKYSQSYDNTTFAGMETKVNALSNLTKAVKDNTSNIQSNDGIFDILGSVFSQGYLALKITFSSVDLFGTMVSESSGELPLGDAATIVQTFMITVIGILIFIGIIVAVIVKWNV
jgi:hypothetical protein